MQTPIPLWPNGAPGALGTSSNDIPTLTPYLPDPTNATGAAMVICPGGAYAHLAPREGNDYALWLNQHGITCFVLKYRLGSNGYHYPANFRTWRARCAGCARTRTNTKLIRKRVGIMGSSAGGHLAATLLTHFDSGDTNSADAIERQSSRPDIGILCYPVITMGEFAHRDLEGKLLLGKNPSPELVKKLSSELHVTRTRRRVSSGALPKTGPCRWKTR
jgi:acetyl esterase/lipase